MLNDLDSFSRWMATCSSHPSGEGKGSGESRDRALDVRATSGLIALLSSSAAPASDLLWPVHPFIAEVWLQVCVLNSQFLVYFDAVNSIFLLGKKSNVRSDQ